MSIAGKILARVLLNCLLDHLEQGLLLESQCGFRAGRGTTDMIFAAHQLQEKCMEQHRDLYTTFVDLTKAFDTVSRDGLWKIMVKFGCPSTFIAVVLQFHDGMMARVLNDSEQPEGFPVTKGVKQGCVLAPTLFSLMLSAMLTDAFRESKPGINITFSTPPHHQRRKHSGRAQDPLSRAEESCTQDQSHQNRQHRQHDTYPVLLDMWERFPRPDWPYQPPPDTLKQLY